MGAEESKKVFGPLNQMKVSHPSGLLIALRWAVRSGKLRRGYGQLLTRLPSGLWGGGSVLVNTEVGKMVLPVSDRGSIPLLLFGDLVHESRESTIIRRLAGSCKVMIDVGAHVGWYACLMWDAMKREGRVYAFEPNPHTFAYLQENARNRSGLFSYQLALGDSEKSITFYCAKSSGLSCGVRQVGPSVTVGCTTLDSFCRSLELVGQVDFVKCDVEGGEVSVLRGARQICSATNPPIWMIEIEERFLVETGTSADEATYEILSVGRPTRLFYLEAEGVPKEIEHVSERHGTSNVFIVPEPRMHQFSLAVGS